MEKIKELNENVIKQGENTHKNITRKKRKKM